jgi:hypothetical protein
MDREKLTGFLHRKCKNNISCDICGTNMNTFIFPLIMKWRKEMSIPQNIYYEQVFASLRELENKGGEDIGI